jgi:hypothetical protein
VHPAGNISHFHLHRAPDEYAAGAGMDSRKARFGNLPFFADKAQYRL